MSQLTNRLLSILQDAEKELRELIVEAARNGDYEGIDVARTTAGSVRDLIAGVTSSSNMTVQEPCSAKGASSTASRLNSAQVVKKPKKGEYPKFYVQSGLLHKVGWSKSEKAEYVHKIPKDAYEHTIRVIGELASHRERLFTSEQIAERLECQGFQVPIYQVYLTLAFLRERRIVQKKGRDGYVTDRDVVTLGIKLWSEL